MYFREFTEDKVCYIASKNIYYYEIPKTYFNERKRIYAGNKSELPEKVKIHERKIQALFDDEKPTDADTFYKYTCFFLIVNFCHYKRSTFEEYQKLIDDFIKGSKIDMLLSELTKEEINDYLDQLAVKYQKEIAKTLCKIIKGALKLSGNTDIDESKIRAGNSIPPSFYTTFTDNYIMSEEEYAALLDYIMQERILRNGAAKIIVLSMYSGISLTESSLVKYSDLEFNMISDKNGENILMPDAVKICKRKVPLPKNCSLWLNTELKKNSLNAPFIDPENDDIVIYQKKKYDETLPLFLSRNNTIINNSSILHTLYKGTTYLGIPKGVNSMTLQVSFAKRAVSLGADLNDIAAMLKNASSSKDYFKRYYYECTSESKSD